jgi:diguanylate cyclase (GGDEF)-like protein/PAS domain S-box-containing protein
LIADDGEMPGNSSLVISGYALPLFAAAALMLFFAGATAARARGSTARAPFLLMAGAVAIWLSCIGMAMGASSYASAEFWARSAYIGVCTIPAAVLQFSVALVPRRSIHRILTAVTWMLSALFMMLFLFTDLFITGIRDYEWGSYPRLSVETSSFLLFFAAALTISLVTLARHRGNPELTHQQRRRIGAFFGALSVGYLGSVDYLPSFGVEIYPFGWIAIAGFVALSARAIRRFRFSDLDAPFIAAQLLDSIEGAVLAVDRNGIIRVANRSAASLLGSTVERLERHDLNTILGLSGLPRADSSTFGRQGQTRNRVLKWTRGNGDELELSVNASMLRDPDGLPVGVLYVLHDLTERRRAEKHRFDATHDPLTGLPNRTHLVESWDQMLADAVARGRTLALLFLDLDGFKAINDTFGHQTGDEILKNAALRLCGALREEDLIVRLGGDEFVCVASVRSPRDTDILAVKLKTVLSRPFRLDRLTARLSASIGAACASESISLDDVIAKADQEMYSVKRRRTAVVAPAQTELRA